MKRREFGRTLGSGVVVSKEGHILTNHHVVREMTEARVQFSDGRNRPARLIGSDVLQSVGTDGGALTALDLLRHRDDPHCAAHEENPTGHWAHDAIGEGPVRSRPETSHGLAVIVGEAMAQVDGPRSRRLV